MNLIQAAQGLFNPHVLIKHARVTRVARLLIMTASYGCLFVLPTNPEQRVSREPQIVVILTKPIALGQ